MEIKKYFLFVLIALFTLQVSAQEYYEVIAKQLNVMNAPTLDGQVLGQLKEHALVQVLNTSKGWATIKYEDGRGFVVFSGLQALDEGDEPTSGGAPENSQGKQPQTGNIQNSTASIEGVAIEVIPKKVRWAKGSIASGYKAFLCLSFVIEESVRVNDKTFIPVGSILDVDVQSVGWDKDGYELIGAKHPAYTMKQQKEAVKMIQQEVETLVVTPRQIILSTGQSIPVQAKEIRMAEYVKVKSGKGLQTLARAKLIWSPFTVYVTPQGTN